ncbi:hypothetical protein CRG98_023572 [Punica granatum]|uniref:Uncharacterized protein n=1 Tax=Punica granatum TaxID=22663 RepID=A0A2I0JIE7_PUNGR|nr:hypothetical protein CRG98_023572 [Punica granatum]
MKAATSLSPAGESQSGCRSGYAGRIWLSGDACEGKCRGSRKRGGNSRRRGRDEIGPGDMGLENMGRHASYLGLESSKPKGQQRERGSKSSSLCGPWKWAVSL